MRKVKLDNEDYFIEDVTKDDSIFGTISSDYKEEPLEKTQEIKVINEKELLEDTLVDLWGENNG